MIKDVSHPCVCDGGGTLFVCQVQGVHMYHEKGSRMRGGAVMSWLWAFRSAPPGVFASCILQQGRPACSQTTAKPRNRLSVSASSVLGCCGSRGIVSIRSSRRPQCVST